jgi:hypothetical protein
MTELTKELMEKVTAFYQDYTEACDTKKTLSSDNKAMKEGFLEHHFGDESKVDPEEKKRIKKEIGKYFRSVEETNSGSDPVTEVREVRKDHLGLADDQYKELMTIFNAIVANVKRKDEIDDDLVGLYRKFGLIMDIDFDVAKGLLKLWYETDKGKFPVNCAVVDAYKTLKLEIGKVA